MTSKFTEPSTGQSFSETSKGYSDLASLAPKDFNAPLGESMAGGNMETVITNGLPGTSSEQSSDIAHHSVPGLDQVPVKKYTHDVGGK